MSKTSFRKNSDAILYYAAMYARIIKHIGDVAKAQHNNKEKNR
jgi:hypothetical protein